MDKKAIYLYLGYPKTGTTWVQAQELSGNHGILVFGKCGIPHSASYTDEIAKEFCYEYLLFDQEVSKEAAIERYLDYFVSRINDNEERSIVFSDESVMDVDSKYNNIDFEETLDRLKSFFDQVSLKTGRCVKLIITLREQKSYLHSIYRQMWEDNHVYPGIETFAKFISRGVANPGENQFGAIDYDAQLGRICRIFGEDSVGVFLYEHFRDDPESFLDEMFSFLGCERGARRANEPLRSSTGRNQSQRAGELYVIPREKYIRVHCKIIPLLIKGGQKLFRIARHLRLRRGPVPSFNAVLEWFDERHLIPIRREAHTYRMSVEDAEAVDAMYSRGNALVASRFKLPLSDAGYALK